MKLFAAILLGVSFLSLGALDHTGVRNVRSLLKEKRFEEAAEACRKMAGKTGDPKEKQFYAEMAVQAFLSAGDKSKAAGILDIMDDPVRRDFVFMKFFGPEEVVARTRGADFSKMPADIISDAYALRGAAFLKRGDLQTALSDLMKSLDLPGGSLTGVTSKNIADYYSGKGDGKTAEEYYIKAVEASSGAFSWRCQAILRLSEILVKKGNAEKALGLYTDDLFKRVTGKNKPALYASQAEVLKSLDRKSEALAALENAVKFADDASREAYRKQLNKLAEEML